MSTALPQNFLNSIKDLPGYNTDAFAAVHEKAEPVTSIRFNPLKPTNALIDLPITDIVPWCSNGRYLSARPSFTLDPVFHGGAYYVQEASSMFLDHVVKQICRDSEPPNRVLDLCAAPGGKSTLLAAALPDSFIVSNEVIKTRAGVLAENISKWGSNHVIVTNNDPRDFSRLAGYFDLIVIDAPCSGSGLFRKDADAIDEWSPASVQMCSLRQQRIVTDAIGALRQNGYLVYSTCSYSREEDEHICDWIIEEFKLEAVFLEVDPAWGIIKSLSEKHGAPGYRFYPDKVQGEGFFIACFKQPHTVEEMSLSHSKPTMASKQVQAIAAPFLKNFSEYILRDQKEIVIASLKKWTQDIDLVSKNLNVRKSGVAVGTVKGKDLVPHHELALSHLLPPNISVINLVKEDALKYLRRQDLSIDFDTKGWAVCSYEHIPIGWVKVLPNRVNNYYPTNWRILKT